MKIVFCVCNESLVDFNHTLNENNSTLIIIIKLFRHLPSSWIKYHLCIASDNNTLDTLQILYLYRIKSTGPIMEPWGTSHFFP